MSKPMINGLLLLSVYLSAVSYGAIYLLVKYTEVSLAGSPANVGQFLMFAGVVAVLMSGYSGFLAKKMGAHKVAALGALSTTVATLSLFLISNVSFWYFACAPLIGLGWSFCYAASPMMVLSPRYDDSERGSLISLISVCVVLGTSTLPSVSSLLSVILSVDIIYAIAAMTGIIAAILFLFVGTILAIEPVKRVNGVSALADLFKLVRTEAVYPFLMVFFGACIVSTLLNFQTLYAGQRGVVYALFYTVYSLTNILSRILFGGVLTSRNPMRPVPYLMILMAVGISMLIANTGSNVVYAVSAFCLGLAYGLAYPLIKTYAIKVTPEDKRHDVLAGFTLSYFIGIYFFPIVVTTTYEIYGINAYLALLLMVTAAYFFVALGRQHYSRAFFTMKQSILSS